MADETVYECQNCSKRWKMGELINPIPDLEERVAPGEPMPAGECPDEDCGAVCHVVEVLEKLRVAEDNKPTTILDVTFVVPRISNDEMTVAIVEVKLTPEAVKEGYDRAEHFLPFLTDAVSKWVAETKKGKKAWEDSSHHFHIGDLSMCDLDVIVKQVGVKEFMTSLKITCHVGVGKHSDWTYDTVLVDDSAFEEIKDVS